MKQVRVVTLIAALRLSFHSVVSLIIVEILSRNVSLRALPRSVQRCVCKFGTRTHGGKETAREQAQCICTYLEILLSNELFHDVLSRRYLQHLQHKTRKVRRLHQRAICHSNMIERDGCPIIKHTYTRTCITHGQHKL